MSVLEPSGVPRSTRTGHAEAAHTEAAHTEAAHTEATYPASLACCAASQARTRSW
jgi:hypothetical protein